MDLQELLSGNLSPEITELISSQLGMDENKTKDAIGLALPTIIGALANNASSQEGASSLFNALKKDHSGDTGDLAGLAMSALQGGEGAAILKHILGNKEVNVASAVEQNVGLNSGQGAQLLQLLAPLVLKALGSQTKTQGLNMNDLAGLLNMFTQQQKQQAPKNQNLIEQLLDKNNDGSIVDDALKMGAGLFGKLFKK